MPSRLMLLDTASMYFRAFYGVPDTITAGDGTPVNAVRGLLDFMTRLVAEYEPTHLACCWDEDWRPAWRVRLLPSYKAHRVEYVAAERPDAERVPDPLQVQVPVIREVLSAFGIAVAGATGYEADDVIGTLAVSADMPVDVVTGDRDLFQVVDDERRVRVLYIARGVGRHERISNAEVRDKYGIDAGQYADFATLRGDPSDGLPGVPGIGGKTAASLLRKFGDMAALRAAAADGTGELTGSLRRKIAEAADYLEVAPRVVAVARDVDLGRPDLRLRRTPAQPDRLVELAERWNLGGPVTRLVQALTDLPH